MTESHHYYVNDNSQDNGDHEVHKEGCSYLPDVLNRTYLGMFPSCHGAVQEARNYYGRVNGCFWCAYPCHTS